MPELLPYAPGSPEWLAARRLGVTATDIVTILGLSSWNSPYSLFWQKMGQVPETPDNDRWRLGRELERYVAIRWGEANGDPAVNLAPSSLWRHSDRSWQMATTDRTFSNMPLELKTWADADKPSWSDGPPAAVRVQNLWQMDVMEAAKGHVGVVFLPSGEFRSYTIEHDGHGMTAPPIGARFLASDQQSAAYADEIGVRLCDVCTDLGLMRAAGEEFMQRLRLELPAPDPDASAATLAAVKARFAKTPDKQAEIDGTLYAAWADTKDLVSHYEGKVRGYESEIREQAGEASVLTVDGQPVARRMVVKQHVREHDRTQDYLKRIAPKETDDGA